MKALTFDLHLATQYDEEEGHEAYADCFQKAMTYYTKQSLRGGEVDIAEAFDWKSAHVIMDVGGGRGEMLSHCMAAAGPKCRGILYDRQWVLDRWGLHFKSHVFRLKTSAVEVVAGIHCMVLVMKSIDCVGATCKLDNILAWPVTVTVTEMSMR